MNDDDLANSLGRSVDLRLRRVSPRPDMEDLLARVGRRASRQRRWLVGAIVAVLAAGGFAGYLIGQANEEAATPAVAAQSEGLPPAGASASSLAFEPADVDAARAAVAQAFDAAFAGRSSDGVRSAAVQDGSRLEALRRDVLANAHRYGYTTDQLAGTTIDVLGVSFIDETHAVVRFTVTIPDHGDVLVDRVGYAIFEGGRWRVALRTACDLLSLNGLRRQCPPQ
jgi:hypothetical protein